MSDVKSSLLRHGRRPRMLDLFCGAGGAGTGYDWAGFEVVGVDIHPQRNYPFQFVQADAIEYLRALLANRDPAVYLDEIDAIHASPPCQRDSAMSACRPGLADSYPSLIAETRELLIATGLPWVIENVPGAPLRADVTLCGQMFGLPLYRHRLFESNVALAEMEHPEHVIPASRAGHWTPGTIMSVAGHVAPIAHAREAMGIDWTTREELAEAIPPAYTNYIGTQVFECLRQREDERVAA